MGPEDRPLSGRPGRATLPDMPAEPSKRVRVVLVDAAGARRAGEPTKVELAEQTGIGVVLPWVLLGVAAYPFLFAVGWAYVHLAERTERDFTDLVERP